DDLKSKSLQAEFGEKRSFGRGFCITDITEENKSHPCPTEWLFRVDIVNKWKESNGGLEVFWFNGKLAQQSSEKVFKDAMKPSQNSSAYVYESWRRTESNRFFTRLLNDQVTFYTPGRDKSDNRKTKACYMSL
ncbi:hypothetical protein IGI04_039856, partial [Brassica rapa subsp. trilocularis]